MINSPHTCPKCSAPLSGAFERPIKTVQVERVHALGGMYLERRAETEVVGDCARCGLVRKMLWSVPREVRMG